MCVFVCQLHPATENTAHEIKLEGKLRSTDKSKDQIGGKKRWQRRCRCWREGKSVSDRFTKEMERGMVGTVMCCKVWTAQRLDSLAVIITECSLIDGLSLQDFKSTSVLWVRPLWKCAALLMRSSTGLLFPAAWFMSSGALFWPGQACSPNYQVGLKTIALSTINELRNQRATTTTSFIHSLILKPAFKRLRIRSCYQRTHQQEEGEKNTEHWCC